MFSSMAALNPSSPNCCIVIQTFSARNPRVCWKPYSLNHGGPPTPVLLPSVRRYGGTRLNADRIASASRTSTRPASTGTNSHLCGSSAMLSARASGASRSAYSSERIAGPPYAASTCSQTSCRRQTSAIASRSSMAPVLVVPAVATTAIG